MTLKRLSPLITVVVLLLSQPLAVLASAPVATLTGLTVSADLIVIARVEKVSANASGERIADAIVLEVWKGEPVAMVSFRASRSWVCDVSEATENETVLLFLMTKPSTPVLSIAYWGQGRIPVMKSENSQTVSLGMQEECIRANRDRLEMKPPIGLLDLQSLKGRVDRILKENRQECTQRSWIA